eukprot:GHVL01025444.1.p1 GENE.GHVL01025444.1~~GHVL01025444.1.p1  ORF type:complete len:600 (+),score=133.23 GHVL01025444.1:43-1842(+)
MMLSKLNLRNLSRIFTSVKKPVKYTVNNEENKKKYFSTFIGIVGATVSAVTGVSGYVLTERKEKVYLGDVSNFENGSMHEIKILGGKSSVLVSKIDNIIYVTGALCSHYSAPLVGGMLCKDHIKCPWHDAEFDIKTGKCINGPSLDGIPIYIPIIENNKLYINISDNPIDIQIPTMYKRDNKNNEIYIILGGGAAGITAVETLRQEGYTGRIIFISDESTPPYDRPVLSKNLAVSVSKITLRDEKFLTHDCGVEWYPGHKVQNLDSLNNKVILDDGKAFNYDKILVCTGSSPRKLDIPGSDLKNILVLRTPEDAAKINKFAVPGANVVVIGSSFIGVEIAAALKKKKVNVTVVGMESVPFERVLGPKVGNVVLDLIEENAVRFIGNTTAVKFKGRGGAVNAVELVNGEVLAADAVVLGVGSIPNTDYIQGIKMEKDKSIPVDVFMRSRENPNVYAAGDVATFPYFRTAEQIRVEHWDVAMQQGRVAAKNMLNKNVPFNTIPFFWTMLFGKSIRYAGYAKNFDEVVVEGDTKQLKFVAFYAKDKNIHAVATMNYDPFAVQFVEALKLRLVPQTTEIIANLANSKFIVHQLDLHVKTVDKK